MYDFGTPAIVLGDTFFRGDLKNAFRAFFTGNHFHNVRFYDMKRSSFEECTFVMCDFASFSELVECTFYGCTFIGCTFKSPAFKETTWSDNKFTDCCFEKVDCCIDGKLVGKNFLCVDMNRDCEYGTAVKANVKTALVAICGAHDCTAFYTDRNEIFVDEHGKTFMKMFLAADAEMRKKLGNFVYDVVWNEHPFRIRTVEIESAELQDAVLEWLLSIGFSRVHYQMIKLPYVQSKKAVSMEEDDIRNMKYFPTSIQIERIDHDVTVKLFVSKDRVFKRARKSKRKKS